MADEHTRRLAAEILKAAEARRTAAAEAEAVDQSGTDAALRARLAALVREMRGTAEAWQRDPLVADDQMDAARCWADDLAALLAEAPPES